uniref:Uncharacterized protein n=1 Tax=Cyprinus carpio TaxID=7962 RepID=A0A8C1MFS3_CYPCA
MAGMLRMEHSDLRNNRFSHNLSLNEKKVLTQLINDPNIIIKSADKGGMIVGQDNMYQSEILTFLKNTKTQGWISQSEFDFLYCQHPIKPVFYTLPKIHKILIDPPGRPIVAQTNSLLSPLSQYVDVFIKPFVQLLQSYIKDSSDFINKISEQKNK